MAKTLVLVPQGAEFQAVCRGLRSTKSRFDWIAIPVGIEPVSQFLSKFWRECDRACTNVLVMGLCGSLSADLQVGDGVIYQTCQSLDQQIWQCATVEIENTKWVRGFTSDRVVCKASEKQVLHRSTGCSVVDMEGTAILQFFAGLEIEVTMLRVVSDDCLGDLPDLAGAIDSDGQLRPFPLAIKMLQQPIAAVRLIRGSMQGLKQLEKFATELSL